ncbi:MAG TPA: DoxX family protein [Burkholderiales bacterium]|nr:DoxX family protein [Burkholderiales bacterium]
MDPQPLFSQLAPLYAALEALSDPLLRIAVGAFLIPHGTMKLAGWFGADLAGEHDVFNQAGLRPTGVWISVIGLIQFAGGILLVLGMFTRPVALAETVTLIGTAVYWTRRGGWFWHRGGMEYSLFWALAAFVVFCHGSGRFSIDALLGWQL